MDRDARANEKLERAAGVKDRAFKRFLEDPMLSIGMSLIPAGDHTGTLKLLLRAAFDAGFHCGGEHVVTDIVESIVEHDKKRHG